ncbi:SGNH/GDSL hydrolase family protein [Umezawaea sp. Da 62-37]|uniref:SGNH/GDSL hydrolase family protein n=1 Tax=Umezawaea sp. Da 62-37 TaxID=3075927 RepID=UPI0028F6C0DE|nr:SGNH/GDSL hydrolase family protein [Umezawaea sp. Da 62-37]WNV85912.1 SGNH/GDSL hydrolase family protein [Umezawaea sp. Da 62-37]
MELALPLAVLVALGATLTAPTAEAGPLTTAHTAGRVTSTDQAVRYTWPGISFEGRFRGTGVGIALNDSANDYDVQVDGKTVATLVTPGRTTSWVRGLSSATHTVRLVKRTESPWAEGEFDGFVADAGGVLLAPPQARRRQVEFIGDSFTAGYGNTSTTRDCSTNGGVDRHTNADLSFGALTARGFGADYQITAQSGLGVVRNYGGGNPDVDFRTFYDRASQNGGTWPVPRTWHPQVVVVGLGINDFSTPVDAGERWTPETLVTAYKAAYHGFLDKLRARYGASTTIVVSATPAGSTTTFPDTARRIVEERYAAGDSRVHYWYYDDPRLDHLGCDWHPSLNDHRVMSELLTARLAQVAVRW